jgi:transcriptional regulator with XRE-family HTH domain
MCEVFAKRIKKCRKISGMTMAELAYKLNLKKTSINAWENNGYIPKAKILIKLSKLFYVSIDFLLGNEDLQDVEMGKNKIGNINCFLKNLNDENLNKAESLLDIAFDDFEKI